jgi:VanZ family protein
VPLIFGVPFHGYYQNPEIKAIDDVLVKMAMGVPLGMFLGWLVSVNPGVLRRAAVAIACVLTAIFFVVIEAGQILLPSRYPDNTDIVLGLAGALLGSWVVRALRPLRAW